VKQVLRRNILWNGMGTVIPLMAGFVVAPFLVHRLGETGYGLWILIASLTGYFSFLDLGVRGSVGRNIAFHKARGDQEGVNTILSTALALLAGAAAVALLATVGVLVLFFHLFEVPADQAENVRIALLIVGINLALTFPGNLFDATLWAFQRFDILNWIDIPAVLLRTGLTFYVVGNGHGLVGLALITLATTLGSTAAKAVMSFRTDRSLRVRLRSIRFQAARSIYGYGIWLFILSVSRLVLSQVSPLIIGARLAVEQVTPFSIAARLITYATSLLVAATGVLTPLMTALHAEEKYDQQRRLFLDGGKFCLVLALYFLAWFAFLGRPFIVLWVGPALESASTLLLILAIAEIIPMSQWATHSMILGMGRHRVLALASIVENLAAISLALAWVGPYGLVGVCLALAIPGVLCRGVVQVVFGCRLARVSPGQYGIQVLLPAVAAAALPTVLLAALSQWAMPETWLQLALVTGVYSIAFLVGCVPLLGSDRVWRQCVRCLGSFSGARKKGIPTCLESAETTT
jgi:O-antigen/teichoic acid export membrane protein